MSTHRNRMEKSLGRKLKPKEHIHHIDGNHKNNDLGNLLVVSQTDHNRIHGSYWTMEGGMWIRCCSSCNTEIDHGRSEETCPACSALRRKQFSRYTMRLPTEVANALGWDLINEEMDALSDYLCRKAKRLKRKLGSGT